MGLRRTRRRAIIWAMGLGLLTLAGYRGFTGERSSESISEGHPDKVCDQISDAVLDAFLEQDPNSRVACETMANGNTVKVGGEITSTATVDIENIVRSKLKEIGYNDAVNGIDWETCNVIVEVRQQSNDISQGVTEGEGLHEEQGAGDQGMMVGFATDEDLETFMPLTLILSHRLLEELSRVRKSGEVEWLRPDSKAQVTIRYWRGIPVEVTKVVLSTQHTEDIAYEAIKDFIINRIIRQVIPPNLLTSNTEYLVNPTGRFVMGGPNGDCGLTGRKIIVDTYGGRAGHGGGAFSGKDPSKVDRSAAYLARWIAKHVVKAGLARECRVDISYAIGVAGPMSVSVDTNLTGILPDHVLAQCIEAVFPLKPADFIAHLRLKRPIYSKTVNYGHFGKNDPDLTWEQTDLLDKLVTYVYANCRQYVRRAA